MSRWCQRLILVSCVTLVAACQAPGTREPPAESRVLVLQELGESANFPIRVAGYRRGPVILYDPSFKNFSVGYSAAGPAFRSEATLYISAKPAGTQPIEVRFREERAAIESTHESAELLAQDATPLQKDGRRYPSRRALYRVSELAGTDIGPAVSELILIDAGEEWVKLRSTTPARHARAGILGTGGLLAGTNWAPVP